MEREIKCYKVLWSTRKDLEDIVSRGIRRGQGKKRSLGDTARALESQEGI